MLSEVHAHKIRESTRTNPCDDYQVQGPLWRKHEIGSTGISASSVGFTINKTPELQCAEEIQVQNTESPKGGCSHETRLVTQKFVQETCDWYYGRNPLRHA